MCSFIILKVKVKFKKQERINLMATLVEHFLATVKHLIGEPTKPQEFAQQEEPFFQYKITS